jgi:hypothetical protein
MKKIRILIIASLLIAVLIPVAVHAEGAWYCDSLTEGDGNGTWYDPWGCALEDEFDTIIKEKIGNLYGGGFLYELFANGYTIHEIAIVDGEPVIVRSTDFAGYPPNTGVEEIPMPIILGAVAVGGAALVLIGLVLRRKKLAN